MTPDRKSSIQIMLQKQRINWGWYVSKYSHIISVNCHLWIINDKLCIIYGQNKNYWSKMTTLWDTGCCYKTFTDGISDYYLVMTTGQIWPHPQHKPRWETKGFKLKVDNLMWDFIESPTKPHKGVYTKSVKHVVVDLRLRN